MRAVESSVSHGTLNPFDGWINNCFPPHDFIFLLVITNFIHQIYFIMMVSIFVGYNEKSL
jgi:hypothetical protein